MTFESILERRNKNLSALLASPILAKGIVRMEDGRIEIITVHSLSTRHEFYIIHKTTSKSIRAPRKTWKQVLEFARDFVFDYKPYTDFPSFVAYYAGRYKAEVLGVRLYKKRRLAALQIRTERETLTTDWQAVTRIPSAGDFEKLNKKFQRKLTGHKGW